MTSYNSFKDLEKIDADLALKFKQKGEAVRWCMAIEGPIAQWVRNQARGEGGKALYELVWFASVRKGFFDNNLPRNKRAEILAKFCPDAFCTAGNRMSYDPAKAAKALRWSMEQCKYKYEIKDFKRLPDAHLVRKYVSEIEALIDGQELPALPQPHLPSIEERLEAYLRKDVVEKAEGAIFQRIDVQKDFGDGIVPGLSVSKYHSKRFLDEDKPSHVEAYEFHHAKLTINELFAYCGKYGSKRHIKLYVVSPVAFDREVIKLAEERYIGLVLVSVNEEMTEDSYIVQRSIADYAQRQLDMDVLTGHRPMQSSLMIYDGANGRLSTSLADSLVSDGIAVVPECIIKAPYLTNGSIEKIADNLSQKQVNELEKRLSLLIANPTKKILGNLAINLITLEVDPTIAAKDLGVAYEYGKLSSDEQLGYIDIAKETIFLQSPGNNYARDRFTFAHELGHYLLHLTCFKHYCYSSVGETDKTIDQTISMTKGELSWFEHHANCFAACFLMPRELVYKLYALLYYEYVQKKYGDRFGALYFNPKQPETLDSYRNVVVRMARILCVSQQAMTLRLKKMGLLRMPPETDSSKDLFRIAL